MPNTGVARIWCGATRAEDGQRYLEYLHETGLPGYRHTPGNRGAMVLRRRINQRAEFLVISFWESHEVIRRFAGEDIERAVFYPRDDEFLIERDLTVRHYDVIYQDLA